MVLHNVVVAGRWGGYVTFRNTNFELVGQQPRSHRVRPHEEREAKPASEL
jgi:hypothetical protein